MNVSPFTYGKQILSQIFYTYSFYFELLVRACFQWNSPLNCYYSQRSLSWRSATCLSGEAIALMWGPQRTQVDPAARSVRVLLLWAAARIFVLAFQLFLFFVFSPPSLRLMLSGWLVRTPFNLFVKYFCVLLCVFS